MAKKRVELGQHRTVGRQLHAARNALQSAGITLHNIAPSAGYRELAKVLLKMHDELDTLRSRLDDAYCREWSDDFCPHIYYPGGESDREDHARGSCEVCKKAADDARIIG